MIYNAPFDFNIYTTSLLQLATFNDIWHSGGGGADVTTVNIKLQNW